MSAERPAAIFHNLAAASAGSWRVRRAIELTRAALDADLHVTATRDPAELAAWLSHHIAPYRTAIIAAGDGSLGVAYNVAAARPELTLGYLPAGFGNATAHLLRLPRDPVTLAAVLTDGEARPIDLVAVDDRLALFAGAGWDARVAERYAAGGAHRLLGWAAAIAASLPDLVARPRVSVQVDGRPVHDGPMELLVVSTTPWYGRGLLVNPGARPERGELTARLYAGPLPRFTVDAARWLAGRRSAVPALRGASIVLRASDGRAVPLQADGDVLGRRAEWRFEVRPAAVRLIGRW